MEWILFAMNGCAEILCWNYLFVPIWIYSLVERTCVCVHLVKEDLHKIPCKSIRSIVQTISIFALGAQKWKVENLSERRSKWTAWNHVRCNFISIYWSWSTRYLLVPFSINSQSTIEKSYATSTSALEIKWFPVDKLFFCTCPNFVQLAVKFYW